MGRDKRRGGGEGLDATRLHAEACRIEVSRGLRRSPVSILGNTVPLSRPLAGDEPRVARHPFERKMRDPSLLIVADAGAGTSTDGEIHLIIPCVRGSDWQTRRWVRTEACSVQIIDAPRTLAD